MNKLNEQDWLDRILSGDTHYIDDNGFTETVLRRLPLRKQHHWRKTVIFSCAILLSVAVLFCSLPSQTILYPQITHFIYSQSLIALAGLSTTASLFSAILICWLLNIDR